MKIGNMPLYRTVCTSTNGKLTAKLQRLESWEVVNYAMVEHWVDVKPLEVNDRGNVVFQWEKRAGVEGE